MFGRKRRGVPNVSPADVERLLAMPDGDPEPPVQVVGYVLAQVAEDGVDAVRADVRTLLTLAADSRVAKVEFIASSVVMMTLPPSTADGGAARRLVSAMAAALPASVRIVSGDLKGLHGVIADEHNWLGTVHNGTTRLFQALFALKFGEAARLDLTE